MPASAGVLRRTLSASLFQVPQRRAFFELFFLKDYVYTFICLFFLVVFFFFFVLRLSSSTFLGRYQWDSLLGTFFFAKLVQKKKKKKMQWSLCDVLFKRIVLFSFFFFSLSFSFICTQVYCITKYFKLTALCL